MYINMTNLETYFSIQKTTFQKKKKNNHLYSELYVYRSNLFAIFIQRHAIVTFIDLHTSALHFL